MMKICSKEAKLELDRLANSKTPFNLNIINIDLHHSKWYLSKSCEERKGNSFESIVECEAEIVANFVNYVVDKGYIENTNILIMGDHLADNNLLIKKPARTDRLIYNR